MRCLFVLNMTIDHDPPRVSVPFIQALSIQQRIMLTTAVKSLNGDSARAGSFKEDIVVTQTSGHPETERIITSDNWIRSFL